MPPLNAAGPLLLLEPQLAPFKAVFCLYVPLVLLTISASADDGHDQLSRPERDFWSNLTDPRIKHVRQAGHLTVPQKHGALTQAACGEYMATFDDDDYYSPDYLSFMYAELVERNVSLVKLGAWPQFIGGWENDFGRKVLSGSMWQLNVTGSPASLGYGFSYFFSRAAARATVHIWWDGRHTWDSDWVGALQAAGYRVAVTNKHPTWLVIKVSIRLRLIKASQ